MMPVKLEKGQESMNNGMYCATGYINLANAVVEQAAKDYRDALIRLDKNPNDLLAEHRKIECQNFFTKEIDLFTNLDGEWLMREIERRLHPPKRLHRKKG